MVSAKKRLIILSDLWGKKNTNWLSYYTNNLEANFEVVLYDTRKLGNVNNKTSSKKLIHQEFVQSGIDKAVDSLLKKEQDSPFILAFSVGGSIAWKAALKGLKTAGIYALSSTRLRFETQKPNTEIALYFGNNDAFVPDKYWFDQMGLKSTFFKNKAHEFYKEKESARLICRTLNARNS